jgi:hypothetical protein
MAMSLVELSNPVIRAFSDLETAPAKAVSRGRWSFQQGIQKIGGF